MKTIKDLPIGSKISVAFSSAIFAFIVSTCICLYSVRAIDQKQKEIEASEQMLLLLKDGTGDYLNIIWAVLANNLNGKASHGKWIIDHRADFDSKLMKISQMDATPEGASLAREGQQEYNAWLKTVVDPLVEMRKKVDAFSVGVGDLSALTESFGSYLGTEKLIAAVGKLESYEQHRMLANRAQLDTLRTSIYVSVLSASLIAVLASILAGRWLSRSISRPLKEAVSVASCVADGDLTNRIEATSADETGQLMLAMKTMNESLASIVGGVRSSADRIASASSEIAAGNLDLSSRTEEQASSLEETAASMTQLTETVRQNADNARQASTLATRASSIADTGNDAVRGMVEVIGRISGSSDEISEITAVIEGIAFQTNILALNAAVEAARAGDQGRGFAVVANEVRALAQRSATAAREIKELIGTSVETIQSGARQAQDAGSTMTEVKLAIKQVADIVSEIAAASDEQSRGIEQVNQAVNLMDKVTQQNAALVEQAAAAAQSLEDHAKDLKHAVSVFVVAEHVEQRA
ncbi:Methyl-accepting chemotaxis citrate transducer [Paraburkholderia sabiae]|uniref:methyl-accepting chemotaxis protein n=1 Tax=Paraburkholderia sabiae TaxID=273251 RepID=UPI001CB5517C|nr:methyl-accepting chemotaxis protein [Paraburkholderia sabiae]CAG9216950.1 Methyl-accepting chemotaxis citrate transducer [Paraburkholderia sabiae]